MTDSSGPKLIGKAHGTSRAFRCLWMLEEVGIPHQHWAEWPNSPKVKKYNPLGKIPILVEDDGFSVYETNAIISYLGDKYGSRDSSKCSSHMVPPAGTKKRALYDQTMSVLATELDSQGLWIHTKHEEKGRYFGHIPDAVEHARKYFNKTNVALIQQLKNNKKTEAVEPGTPIYLIGTDFTATDIVYVNCLDWSKMIGWDAKWKDDATLTKYIKDCKSRDSFIRTKEKVERLRKEELLKKEQARKKAPKTRSKL